MRCQQAFDEARTLLEPVPNQGRLLGTHGWIDGRAWHHDYKSGKKVWTPNRKPREIDTLRAALNETRENLRMAVHVLRCTASTANQSESGWTAPVYRDLLSDINNQVRAFLSRLDAGKAGGK